MALPAGTGISVCPNKMNDEMKRKAHFQIRNSGYKAIILHAYRRVAPNRLWFLQSLGPQRQCILPWLFAYKENMYQLISAVIYSMWTAAPDTAGIQHWKSEWFLQHGQTATSGKGWMGSDFTDFLKGNILKSGHQEKRSRYVFELHYRHPEMSEACGAACHAVCSACEFLNWSFS